MAAIIVIDDDAAVCRFVRAVLERAGHDVVEAHDGEEGVRLFRSAPAELVITDLYMPGQDGIETIQQLRAEFPGVRILAMSGGASAGVDGPLEDARLLGADAALAKPFDIAQLSATVDALLS